MKQLKLLITLLLVFTLCFCVISCSKKENKEGAQTQAKETEISDIRDETESVDDETEKETAKETEEESEEEETEAEEDEQPEYDVTLFSGAWMNENGGFLMVDDEGNWMFTDGTDTTVEGSFSVAENGKILAHFDSKTRAVTVGNESDITIEELGVFIRA